MPRRREHPERVAMSMAMTVALAIATVPVIGASGDDDSAAASNAMPARVAFKVPVSAVASFDPRPMMWGLRTLPEETRVDDVDDTCTLFVRDRIIFDHASDGPVYLVGGQQLITDRPLSSEEIEEQVFLSRGLTALVFEPADALREPSALPAGAYRAAAPAARSRTSSGLARTELTVRAASGSTVRLITWSLADETMVPVAATLPPAMMLTRKVHAGFVDPPVDGRPIDPADIVRPDGRNAPSHVAVVFGDFTFGGAQSAEKEPVTLETAETVRAMRPGFGALLEQIRTGRPVRIDDADYYRPCDRYFDRLDRRAGVSFRRPVYWP